MLRPSPPRRKDLIGDKYKLGGLIGKGGMGSVYEAYHGELGTRVAVKFIDAEFARTSPEAVSRFKNEAKAAGQLRTKHVVDVYDYGVTDDGRPYIVMEFLEGESLENRLERVGRLPLAATAKIIGQVGRALHKAHSAGIVHRDLKPDNIFLVWDDEDQRDVVKVVDFGIAKFTDDRTGVSHATEAGSVLGTPFYMSPEQARGRKDIDLRADLWSLGVVAFQCLTGDLPFYSDSVGDLLIEICTGEIPVPSHVAADLPLTVDAWMARALSRDKAFRFQSAKEMTDALAEALGTEGRPAMQSLFDDQTGVNSGMPSRAASMPMDPNASAKTVHAGNLTTGGASNLSADTLNDPRSARSTAVDKRVLYGVLAAAGLLLVGGISMGLSGGESSPEPDAIAAPEKEPPAAALPPPPQAPLDLDEVLAPPANPSPENSKPDAESISLEDLEPEEEEESQDQKALAAAKPAPTGSATATSPLPKPKTAPAPKPKAPPQVHLKESKSRDVGLGY